MASIRKLSNSRFWIAYFTDPAGKQRQQSTKESDRKKALKKAKQYESAYRQFQTEAQARRVLTNIYEEIHGDKLLTTTVSPFMANWLNGKNLAT